MLSGAFRNPSVVLEVFIRSTFGVHLLIFDSRRGVMNDYSTEENLDSARWLYPGDGGRHQ